MIIDFKSKEDIEEKKVIKEINTFNELMINTIKAKEREFAFKGHNYMVCSDGVCVQTLINERFLYRIFIDEYKNNSFINEKVANFI
ncbi:hypothetical protein LGL08_12795 [Clostridium estertheticum]|uniref:hypothetical protein n=1 Tax=Clostridium estertheticum TaxID=238834 RepID=UPI001CF0EAC6|nr:hypothetical protein [Clostridium estertheticum]MCB2306914.1 hypothetical protein [Clostridium estertheticum]MCB2345297.1 hypothetical protein [Clostridium estertheticum]MCB2350420.1 hypothetical protein [Clostridium estertheticum]WAG45187.1 hypothetical protein LL127_16815 [Clostridium estertheticum]